MSSKTEKNGMANTFRTSIRNNLTSWFLKEGVSHIDLHVIDRSWCTYLFLSLVFLVINWVTLKNVMPWIDEVMFLDTSYNAVFHHSWSTTAWYRVAGEYPFSTYPPIYQFLVSTWMWLFGADILVVRSLNLFIVFLLGALCLRMLKNTGVLLSPWLVTVFTLLLFGTSEMAWMYRNGRPDMLCALVFAFTTYTIDRFFRGNSLRTRIGIVLSAALLVGTGLQTVAYLGILWLFLFLMLRKHSKQLLQLLLLLLVGLFLGMCMVALFMYAHGRLIGFASSIVSYSATLSKIALLLLPWAGETLNFSAQPFVQKLLEQTPSLSLSERLASAAAYRSFLILSIEGLLAYALSFRKCLSKLLNDKGFLLLIFAISVPIMMNIAGRFPIYYRWMAFLPLVMSILFLVSKQRWALIVFSVTSFLLSLEGVKSMSSNNHKDYENMCHFVERQNFSPTDKVVAPFMMFYEIKPLCDTCYFAGIFPTEFIGNVDYVIDVSEGDEFDQRITTYISKLQKDTNSVLTKIDTCEHPSLSLYKVRKIHD